MAVINNVIGRLILDSRGVPTVEASVILDDGSQGIASAPAGGITHQDEAQEKRDGSKDYFGQGVSQALAAINDTIAPRLRGMDPLYQTQVDQAMVDLDGTATKSKLGANAIYAVSVASLKAAAASVKLPVFVYLKEKYQLISTFRIPTPIFNLINGGEASTGTLDFKEFQLVPASHLPFDKALQIGVETFMALDKLLKSKGAIRAVGLEGGFAPNLATNSDAMELFDEALKQTPYVLAKDAFLGLDSSPSTFFKGGKYSIKDRPQPLSPKDLIKFYQELHQQYRVFAFEDPFVPDAWTDWKVMTLELGKTAMILADGLIATTKTRLVKAIAESAANGIIVKPNRVGTVTETVEVVHLAQEADWHTVMSHRSGDTTDDFVADLAVGLGVDYVKFGAPSRGERVVKYNRLLKIEQLLKQLNLPGGEPMEPTNQPAAAPAAMPDPNAAAMPSAPAPTMPEPAPASAPAMPEPAAPVAASAPQPAPMSEPAPEAAPTAPALEPMPEAPAMPAPAPMPEPVPEATDPATPAPEVAAPANNEPLTPIPTPAEIQSHLDDLLAQIPNTNTSTATPTTPNPTMTNQPSMASDAPVASGPAPAEPALEMAPAAPEPLAAPAPEVAAPVTADSPAPAPMPGLTLTPPTPPTGA